MTTYVLDQGVSLSKAARESKETHRSHSAVAVVTPENETIKSACYERN